MDMPPPCMVDHPGSYLYETPDYRVYRWPDALPPECTVADHMEQIIGETSEEKPRLIGCETMTACLIPAKGVLPLFYPVLNLGAAIVCRDHLFSLRIRVGHNETDTREEFTHMPFDFTDNPSGFIPSLRLVMELDHPNLYPALCWTTDRALQMGCDELLEAAVAGKPN